MQKNITGLLLKISQVYFPMNGILCHLLLLWHLLLKEWMEEGIHHLRQLQKKRIPTGVLLLLWQTLLPNLLDLRFQLQFPSTLRELTELRNRRDLSLLMKGCLERRQRMLMKMDRMEWMEMELQTDQRETQIEIQWLLPSTWTLLPFLSPLLHQ